MSVLLPIEFEPKEYNFLSSADPQMRDLIEKRGSVHRNYRPDPFEALLSSIVAQQLSDRVAEKLWARVESACDGTVSPERILALGKETLRAAGLSNNKAVYAENIAHAALDGVLDRSALENLSDEQVISRLTPIKGIGRWTAEMFLIFCLCRKDVISLGDFGIRRGLSILYFGGIMPGLDLLSEMVKRFSPCGTLASMYLWEVK